MTIQIFSVRVFNLFLLIVVFLIFYIIYSYKFNIEYDDILYINNLETVSHDIKEIMSGRVSRLSLMFSASPTLHKHPSIRQANALHTTSKSSPYAHLEKIHSLIITMCETREPNSVCV